MNESPEIGILNAIGKLVLLVNGRMKTCKKAKEMKGYLEIMNQLLDIQQKVVALIPKRSFWLNRNTMSSMTHGF